MREHEDFARGRLRYNSGNKKKLDDMWLSIAASLNSVGGGPRKDPKEWQKTWRDWKSAVLKKCAKNRSYASGTGGGPPNVTRLTQLEEELVLTIDAEMAGLTGIPEGGNFDRVMQRGNMPQGTLKRARIETLPTQTPSTSFKRHQSSSQYEMQWGHGGHETFTSGTEILDDPYSQEEALEEHIDICHNEPAINIRFVHDEIPEPCTSATPQADNLMHQGQGQSSASKKRDSNASAAVDLMRSQLKIKEAKLEIEKEKFEYIKSATSACLTTLSNINENLTCIKEAVEKIAPSYLE